MKKRNWWLGGWLTLALWLGLAGLASAASVPVYIDGAYYENGQWQGAKGEYRLLCQAEERGGYTYVPLRVVFEACGAEVGWDEAGQVITAKVRSDRTLVMTVGSKWAKLWHRAESELVAAPGQVSFWLEATPYLKNGRVYVPLRFVGEALDCGVSWDNSKPAVYLKQGQVSSIIRGDKIWRLEEYSGLVTESDGKSSRRLGQVDIGLLAAAGWAREDWDLYLNDVETTPSGHYIVRCYGPLRGALTHDVKIDSWLAPEKEMSYTALNVDWNEEPQGAFWQGYENMSEMDFILAGDNGILVIDEETGEIKQRFSGGKFRWANREWLLQGNGSKWTLTNRADGSQRDLGPLLLSEENKAKMDDMMRPHLNILGPNDYDDRVRELFWGDIDNDMTLDAKPYIMFLGEGGGKLHFEIRSTWSLGDNNFIVPVEIGLQ